MKNSQVVDAWGDGMPAHSSNLSSDGRTLRSYGTAIAVREKMLNGDVHIYATTRKYSPTTSAHQNLAMKRAGSVYLVDSNELEAIIGHYSGYKTYKIVRFRESGTKRKIQGGLNIAQAHYHCNNDKTHGAGWFDGYEVE